MNKNGNDWWPVSAFQANPSWYEHYWYAEMPPKAPGPVRRLLATVAPWLRKLVQRAGEAHSMPAMRCAIQGVPSRISLSAGPQQRRRAGHCARSEKQHGLFDCGDHPIPEY